MSYIASPLNVVRAPTIRSIAHRPIMKCASPHSINKSAPKTRCDLQIVAGSQATGLSYYGEPRGVIFGKVDVIAEPPGLVGVVTESAYVHPGAAVLLLLLVSAKPVPSAVIPTTTVASRRRRRQSSDRHCRGRRPRRRSSVRHR